MKKMKKMKKKIYCILSALLAFSSCGVNANKKMQNERISLKNRVLNSKNTGQRSNSADFFAPILYLAAGSVIAKNLSDFAKEAWKNKNIGIKQYAPPKEEPPKEDPPKEDPPKENPPKENPLPTTEATLDKLVDWTPVNFTGTSCFVAALSKLMYNPKSAENGTYSNYSKKSLEDIKKEIKDYYAELEKNPDLKSRIKNNVRFAPSDGDENGYNFAANLYYASIINRSAFYDACYKKLQEKKNQVFQMNFGAINGSTGSANWTANMFPVKADQIKFGNWDLYSDVKNPIFGGDPKTPKLNDGHRFEQLFHGSSYRYAEENIGNELRYCGGGDAVGCFVTIDHGSVLNLIHPLSLNITDHILEPDSHYIVIQGDNLKETYETTIKTKDKNGKYNVTKKTMHGKQQGNFAKLEVPIKLGEIKKDELGNKIKDGDSYVWSEDISDYVDVSENGEFPFNGKTYVIVGIETATGGHCEASMPKYFVDGENITLAGWLQHYCGSSAGLQVVRAGEKFTIQQLLMDCANKVGISPTSGIIIKSVPKEDVLKYDYYKINEYKK